MKHTRETITKELQRIQASVPPLLKKHLFVEKLKTPEMKLVAEKALESDMDEEKKMHVKKLLDEGYFDKKIIAESRTVATQIDQYVQREINKSVKAGRLPTKKQLKELNLEQL